MGIDDRVNPFEVYITCLSIIPPTLGVPATGSPAGVTPEYSRSIKMVLLKGWMLDTRSWMKMNAPVLAGAFGWLGIPLRPATAGLRRASSNSLSRNSQHLALSKHTPYDVIPHLVFCPINSLTFSRGQPRTTGPAVYPKDPMDGRE